jgi:hypothetical protein
LVGYRHTNNGETLFIFITLLSIVFSCRCWYGDSLPTTA